MAAPPELDSLQRFMAEAIRRPTTLAEHPDLHGDTERTIAGNDRLSPIEQLDIYREQFFLRHFDALYDDFPAVEHLLGWDGFEALGRAYLAEHPPESYTLRDLGAKLPAFVGDHAPWKNDRLLVDTARVEWAFVEAFDAPDAPPLDPRTLENAPSDAWPRARVVLHPAMRRISTEYPAHELRAAVRDKKEAERPSPSPAHVVIYRGPDAKLRYIDIEREAFELLGLLAEGNALEPACEALAARLRITDAEALEARVGRWFQEWAAHGWITRVEFGA